MYEGLGNLALPARVEVLGRQPTVVLDVAHNVASVRALVKVLLGSFVCEQRTLLLAVTRDKDVAGIVRELAPHFHRVVVTQYQESPRAVPTAELGKFVRAELKRLKRDDTSESVAKSVIEEPRPAEAWKLVQATTAPDELVCITGSFFIAAELRRELLADGSAG